MRYQVYKDVSGEWRWRLVADNGNTIADSAEGYVNRVDAIHEIASIESSHKSVEVQKKPEKSSE